MAGTCTGLGPCDTTPIGKGRNWVTEAGGLPLYIRAIAKALMRKGRPESQAIQLAVGTVQRWARGEGGVTPATRARAAKALAEWEAKKAAAHADLSVPGASAMRDLAGKVMSGLREHYPPSVLGWVKRARWSHEPAVPLSSIDMARRPGGRDHKKVRGIAKAVRGGKRMAPVVLVRTSDGLKVADGYHRTLGTAKAGQKTIGAYIASGVGDHGPWEKTMHDKKLNLASPLRRVIDLAGPHQWKHGYIPLTPAALAIKLHKAHGHAGHVSADEARRALASHPHFQAGREAGRKAALKSVRHGASHHTLTKRATSDEAAAHRHLASGKSGSARDALMVAGFADAHRQVARSVQRQSKRRAAKES